MIWKSRVASVPPRRTASNLIDLLHHIIRQPIKSDQYEYQAFIFLYAAHCLFLMQQTRLWEGHCGMGSDRFSRHLDGFKVRTTGSVGNIRRHRIGQPVLPEQQKRTIIRCHTESGKSPCLIQTVLFRLYGSRKKPESNGCHESHVPAPWQYGSYRQDIKMQVCHRPATLRGAAEKDGFFPIVPRHGKMYRQTKADKQIIR